MLPTATKHFDRADSFVTMELGKWLNPIWPGPWQSGVEWWQKVAPLTLNIKNFFLLLKQMPPNLATFPKIYLATIWYDISWSKQFHVSMATIFWQACFSKFWFPWILIRIFLFSLQFSHFRSFKCLFNGFISFWSILMVWEAFWEIQKSKKGYRMVFASICEHASTASFFASTSSDQISLASSEHFRKYNWRTANTIFC